MRLTYLMALTFTLILAAGWHRLFPRFTPEPGTPAWDRGIIAFAMVALLTSLVHLRDGRTPEAAGTIFVGLVVVGLSRWAGWRYPQLRANTRLE